MRTLLLALLLLAPDEIDDRIKAFDATLRSAKADAERIAAIQDLAKTHQVKAAQRLVQLLTQPFSNEVKIAAANGVGEIAEPALARPLLTALNSFAAVLAASELQVHRDQKVAEAIVRAIGDCRDRAATSKLLEILGKQNFGLMMVALQSLGKIRDGAAIDPIVKLFVRGNLPQQPGTPDPYKVVNSDCQDALQKITGLKHRTSDEWSRWWSGAKSSFSVPPPESLGGFPFPVWTWAYFTGKGEAAALRKFSLVLLNPENYTRPELAGLRAIAISGDPQAALDRGFKGFVVDPLQAAEMRRRFPRAILVSRGAPKVAGANVNAVIMEGFNYKRPESNQRLLDEVREARDTWDMTTLALFVVEKREDVPIAIQFARNYQMIPYVSADGRYATIGMDTLQPSGP